MERQIAMANAIYAFIGAYPALDVQDEKRIWGVDRLTGQILEQRVALEACNG